ncbi:MAG: MFS transporter [Sphingobacteriales bacterium]|jgi:FHS family L-fucose permease-like MFS transporter|nr:MFS transporter [Sphingobacteriales bacterium]
MKHEAASSTTLLSVIAAFFGFFIMGFVDVVGIATNYVKNDFQLSSGLAGTLPMLVFLWFAVFSIPVGIIMGKVGRKKTVLWALAISTVAMFIPYLSYNFFSVIIAFVLLGISNTILQVALNPLVAAMFTKEKTASVLTTGQFIKAIASFIGPIVAGFSASYFGNWKIIFIVFGITSFLSVLLLLFSKVKEMSFESSSATFEGAFNLLKDKFILFCFLGIFFIVGFDVGMNVSIPELLMRHAGLTIENAGYGTSIYFAARTLGSFLGAFLLLKANPIRFLINSLIVALFAFLILLFIKEIWTLRLLIFILGFSCANVFSIIFSYALQRNPTRSNEISALMIMGVAGGAVIPFVQGFVNDSIGFLAALAIIFLCLFFILILTLNLKKNVQ